METLPKRLQSVLDEQGMTAYALAKATGISEATIGRILRGVNNPSQASILMICAELNIGVDWLKSGVGEKKATGERKITTIDVGGRNGVGARLNAYIDAKGIKPSQFANYIGTTAQTLVNILMGVSDPPVALLTKAIQVSPDLSFEWLMTGKGEMIDGEKSAMGGFNTGFVGQANITNLDLRDGDRLFEYFDSKGLSIEEVSTYINIPVQKLQAIRNGDELIDVNMGLHISRSYPDLNYEWVQTGEGDMMLSKSEIKKSKELREYIEGKSLPVVHGIHLTEIRKLADKFLIVAPLVGEFDKSEYVSTWGTKYYPEISQFAVSVDSITLGNYLSVFVPDDSMDDGSSASISKRSIVLGKEIARPDWTHKSVLNRYKIFIIHTTNDILVRKIASYDPSSNSLRCESYNPDKTLYPTIDIKVDDVREIFNIEVITKNL
ncbi:helix-turn-helix transcriptional regulator [Dyadobacter fermentans]|uniref:helix-turn-helix transcriptional regulator n=1 Tax=Dyadobacter fermentans TaxID=94254 RepID=UPI001CBF3A97|nr:helix-turn-helix transcriptional regulator [Dyadobacter fermentans]MBZ1361648.1 helix-turn-helix domain-containing protein [Dyadobacter fermentans]